MDLLKDDMKKKKYREEFSELFVFKHWHIHVLSLHVLHFNAYVGETAKNQTAASSIFVLSFRKDIFLIFGEIWLC